MKSLGTRVVVTISGVLLFLMVVVIAWVDQKLTSAIYQQELEQAEVHAQTLLASLKTLMLNGNGTLAREWLDRLKGTAGIQDIGVLSADGREAFRAIDTIKSVNRYLGVNRFSREPSPVQLTQGISQEKLVTLLRGKPIFEKVLFQRVTVLLPIPTETACLSCHGYDESTLRGVLRLSLSTQGADRKISDMRSYLWGGSPLIVVILGLLLYAIVKFNVLTPVARLRDAITKFGSGERDTLLEATRKDELGELAEVFNNMQVALKASELRTKLVMDNVVDGIITINDRGVISSVNPAVAHLFGYDHAELVGRNITMLMPEPYQKEHDEKIVNYVKTGKSAILGVGREIVGQRKDGTIFPLDLAVSEMIIGKDRYFIGIMRDITSRKAQTAALRYQALHDGLTDLPNRTLLYDRLQQAIRLAQREKKNFALILMDLNRFKEINDTLGHHVGDQILQTVAKRMRGLLRESDTVARLGGDEFSLLLPGLGVDMAIQAAKKIISVVEEHIMIGGHSLRIGTSLGITIYPLHGEDRGTLMQRADVAMYIAKRGNLGYALYDPDQDRHSVKHLALASELRTAIEYEQLHVLFQPKIGLKSKKITGVEALVRWNHPKHGMMSPEEFIPLSEETGLIRPLSYWVLAHSIQQCRRHIEAGIPISMAINISVQSLHDPRLPGEISRMLQEAKVPPGLIKLEITETAIMQDPARALEILSALSNMGIRLSIDDFGTGYSSLAYLKQLPVDEMKIDKSFVTSIAQDENSVVIVRSIIDLAHNLGLKVVAEGVENEHVYDLLEKLGCDIVQGFYMGHPVAGDSIIEWVRESKWGMPA